MADESKEASLVKEAAELVKAATALIRSDIEEPETKKVSARGGPIMLAGRLILGFAFILAVAGSASAFFDLKAAAFQYPSPKAGTVLPNPLTYTTQILRIALALLAVSAIAGTAWLVRYLAKKNPYLLNSPTEYSHAVHADLLGESGDVDTKGRARSKRKPQ